MSIYSEKFRAAIEFTKNALPDLYSNSAEVLDSAIVAEEEFELEDIFVELADCAADLIGGAYKSNFGDDAKLVFSQECANVHWVVLEFLKKHYPEISCNLTIGEFTGISGLTDLGISFPFTRIDFERWRNSSPEKTDCHLWITFGDDAILDLTIGSYITFNRCSELGGMVVVRDCECKVYPFPGFIHADPRPISLDMYSPIAVGSKTWRTIGPKRPAV